MKKLLILTMLLVTTMLYSQTVDSLYIYEFTVDNIEYVDRAYTPEQTVKKLDGLYTKYGQEDFWLLLHLSDGNKDDIDVEGWKKKEGSINEVKTWWRQ